MTKAAATRSKPNAGRLAGLLALLGVIGPGIVAASAGNDAGGISTYSVAGASYGYMTLWAMLAMTPSFAMVQEMAGRMGAVTGKGFSALIRERFGVRLTFVAMVLLLISTASPDGVRVASHNESRVIVKRDGTWKVVHVHKSPAWAAPKEPT